MESVLGAMEKLIPVHPSPPTMKDKSAQLHEVIGVKTLYWSLLSSSPHKSTIRSVNGSCYSKMWLCTHGSRCYGARWRPGHPCGHLVCVADQLLDSPHCKILAVVERAKSPM